MVQSARVMTSGGGFGHPEVAMDQKTLLLSSSNSGDRDGLVPRPFRVGRVRARHTDRTRLSRILVHLLPAAVVLAIVFVSWRRPLIAGVAFVLLAVAYAVMVRFRFAWIVGISGPLMAVGLLNLLCWRVSVTRRRELNPPVDGGEVPEGPSLFCHQRWPITVVRHITAEAGSEFTWICRPARGACRRRSRRAGVGIGASARRSGGGRRRTGRRQEHTPRRRCTQSLHQPLHGGSIPIADPDDLQGRSHGHPLRRDRAETCGPHAASAPGIGRSRRRGTSPTTPAPSSCSRPWAGSSPKRGAGLNGFGVAFIAMAYAAAFWMAGENLWQKGLTTPGGLLFTMAVWMVPLGVHGLERATGFWPARTIPAPIGATTSG